MDEPWFSRFMGLGRFPIHWKGALFAVAFIGFEVLMITLLTLLREDRSVWSDAAGMAFVVSSMAGIAFVEWKTEQSYGRD